MWLFFWFVFFWLLFLFQRFVESTFFCRMYKYIIFVIVIIIILDNPIAVFIYFFLIFSVCLFFFTYIYIYKYIRKCCSFSSKVQVKYQVLFLWFGVKDLSRGVPESWRTEGMHVTLPNFVLLVEYSVNPGCFCFLIIIFWVDHRIRLCDYISKSTRTAGFPFFFLQMTDTFYIELDVWHFWLKPTVFLYFRLFW